MADDKFDTYLLGILAFILVLASSASVISPVPIERVRPVAYIVLGLFFLQWLSKNYEEEAD